VSDSLIIIPTYNEKENIENILRKVFSLEKEFDVLIIEDNSPDGTAAIVKELIKEFPDRLFIEERKGKLGIGTAYIFGFKWALSHQYEFVFEMDADFSHNPDDLLRLYDTVKNKGGDVVIGSRYITGVNVVNWPMGRVLMSYYASAYVRVVTRMKVRDTTAGFICYRSEVLKSMDLSKIRFTGYAFQIEMKFTAWKLGYTIIEVPIIFTDRTLGTSKMSKGIFKEAIFGVITLGWRGLFRKYKRAQN
jgi:dolichol-phosphate mannosyltransferase